MGVVIREPPIFAGCSSTPQVQKASSDSGERDYDDDFYYRVAPETPPIHAGLMGLMSPWTTGGLGLKVSSIFYYYYAVFICEYYST